MDTLQVFLFGKLDVQGRTEVPVSLEARKVQELFCYLLLYRDRPHPREILASLLWSDTSTIQSKSYLRKALWQLQADLNPCIEYGNKRIFLVEPDWVQLNPEASLWLDVATFEQAFTLVQGVPDRELDCQCAQILRNAVNLYRGDLLEGWYLEWCLYERERLQHMYLAMLDKLMGYCEAHQEYEMGLVYGKRILYYDEARERTHRRLMRLHYLAGDRSEALRQYERCVAALAKELEVRPAKNTVALYEQIRADWLNEPPPKARVESEATMTSPSDVLEHLKQLQEALDTIQSQVRQDVQALERLLKS